MIELVKCIALLVVVISDISKMKREWRKIKLTAPTPGLRGRFVQILLMSAASAAPIYYTLELGHAALGS